MRMFRNVLAIVLLVHSSASAALVWEPLADFMDPRTGGAGVEGAGGSIIGSTVYISKGYSAGDTTFLSTYDISTDTWTYGGPTAPDAPGPVKSEGAGGTAGGKHYSVGGRPGVAGTGDEVVEFDPVTDTWISKDMMPTPRRGLGTGSLGGVIYAAGGSDGSVPGGGTPLAAFEVFDPTAAAGSQWTALTSMPIALMDVEATIALGPVESGTVAGAVYVFGGRDATGATVSSVQIYDIATDSWSSGTAMPTARSNAMAGLVSVGALEDGTIAVFGGADVNFFNLDVTELYDPLTDTWMLGPTMLSPVSEQATGMLWDGTGVYSVGSGIFGASLPTVQRLVGAPGGVVPEPTSAMIWSLIAGIAMAFRRVNRHRSSVDD